MKKTKLSSDFVEKVEGSKLETPIKRRLKEAAKYLIMLRITGPFAEFANGKPNKTTSKMMPPSAAAAIAKAICWKPVMRWLPVMILAMKQPKFVYVVRNEPKEFKKNMTASDFMPVSHTLLRDVEYFAALIPYIFIDSNRETSQKFFGMFTDRASRGQYYNPPVLGTSPCLAEVELVDELPDEKLNLTFKEKIFYGWKREPKQMRPIWFDGSVINGRMECDPFVLGQQDLKAILSSDGEVEDKREAGYEAN